MDEPRTPSVKELVLGFSYGPGSAHVANYLQLIVARGLPHERRVAWDTTAAGIDELLDCATHSSKDERGSAALLDMEAETGCFALVWVGSGAAAVHLAGGTVEALTAGESLLRLRLPARVATEDQTIPVAFWSDGRLGPSETSRSIAVPAWADIRGNYPARVATELEPLMSPEYRPSGRGQLILWYGEPGTGKTYGLRALGWQWRKWCAFHYITDPEMFFGRPEYMLQVILEPDYAEARKPQKWKLLILEDTGELLAADAKAQTGQGLSRLLNVVDGIIGQGLRVIVLVTTNDDLRQLHPAVSRPGRCLARNGVDRAAQAGTLASLFGAAAGDELPERSPVGFVG
jgi:ATPase family associated with various cellular activities (AAA)/Domain of unknown function (DUF5925)